MTMLDRWKRGYRHLFLYYFMERERNMLLTAQGVSCHRDDYSDYLRNTIANLGGMAGEW